MVRWTPTPHVTRSTPTNPVVIVPVYSTGFTGNTSQVTYIQGVVNTLVAWYQAHVFSASPIIVHIVFQSINMGAGQSETIFGTPAYNQFSTVLVANSPSAVAAGIVGGASTEPVTGASSINVKSVNLRALGLTMATTQTFCNVTGTLDGCVQINLSVMDVAAGGDGSNSLATVLYHEVNEILGFGSALPIQMGDNGFIFPEDLYRWASPGVRSFSANPDTNEPCVATPRAYFSASSTGALGTNLSDFNNCANGGDYGDWATLSPPVDLVQNAFGFTGSVAVMTTSNPESVLLGLIGYGIGAVATTTSTTTTTTTTHAPTTAAPPTTAGPPTTAPPPTSAPPTTATSSSSSSSTSSTLTTAAPTTAPIEHSATSTTDNTAFWITLAVLGSVTAIFLIVVVACYGNGPQTQPYRRVGQGYQPLRARIVYV